VISFFDYHDGIVRRGVWELKYRGKYGWADIFGTLAYEKLLEELTDDLESGRLILPTLPEVALRVRDAIEDETATASQLAKIVGTDAALSARLLQVANSPLYRSTSPIENIQTAIARMGSIQVRNLVNSLVMQQMFQATNEKVDTRLRHLWEHSVQVASISYVLASHGHGLQRDQAMLAVR